MNLDLVTYGNPTQEQLKYLETSNFIDTTLFDELTSYKFPKNSSEATKEELNQIVDSIKLLQKNDEHLNRYKTYDRYLFKYFIDGLIKGEQDAVEVKNLIESIKNDISPLLLKLKYFHQRPRPYQLAEYYKLKLFPYQSFSADSPSFPSGHAYQGKILTEVIGNLYPQTYSFMTNLFDDIMYSRLYLGLHYQSDIDVGIFCAEKVLNLKEFKSKYRL
jgi:hypothetical protein